MNLKKRVFVSITGRTQKEWESKLKEIEEFNIKKIALFLEIYPLGQRRKIYEALLNSCVKSIPLVHIRSDMKRGELKFLQKNFKSNCFTIHECSFRHLKEWRGFYKKLYLEMNKDNKIPKEVDVSKIGGFCVDLSHFKAEEELWSKEFEYIIQRSGVHKYFKCNHLNGYSYKENRDLHTVTSLKQFSYLKTLPEFAFGKYIAIETFNSIKEQLKFKDYVIKLLGQK